MDETEGLPAYIRATLRAMAIALAALWWWQHRQNGDSPPSPLTLWVYKHNIDASEEAFGQGRRIKVTVELKPALVESMSEDQERARRLERLRVDACELLLDADCDPQVATWEEAGKAALRLLRAKL